jgi:hypothetical protein
MPVIFNIKDKEYSFPQSWEDVTLDKWLKSLEIKKPEKLAKLHSMSDPKQRASFVEKEITPEVYGREIVPYFVKYFCFWSGVSEDIAMQLKMDELETFYTQIETNLNRSVEQYAKTPTDTIEHGGRTYYLPTKHLRKSTVNEFIEAAQAEHHAKQLKGNQLHAIPKLLCIFLKSKKDAPYDPRQMQREQGFMSMTMDKVFRVSFFLLRLNEKLLQDSLIYTALLRLSQAQHKDAQA